MAEARGSSLDGIKKGEVFMFEIYFLFQMKEN
jgi:hypothetical protein